MDEMLLNHIMYGRPISFIDNYDVKCSVELPTRYIINQDATILFFSDGSKVVVKRCKDDEFNPRLAFLTAFFQKYCGMSKNKANKYLASLQVEEEKTGETKKAKHMKEEE